MKMRKLLTMCLLFLSTFFANAQVGTEIRPIPDYRYETTYSPNTIDNKILLFSFPS